MLGRLIRSIHKRIKRAIKVASDENGALSLLATVIIKFVKNLQSNAVFLGDEKVVDIKNIIIMFNLGKEDVASNNKSFYHESDQMRYAQLTIRIGFSQWACILLCTRLPAAGLWANFHVKPFICPGWIMAQPIRGVGGKFPALWPPPIVIRVLRLLLW